MATNKKKAAPVKKKAPVKAAKVSKPAKKAAPKKAAPKAAKPMKKSAPVRKSVPKKSVPLKKSAPVKKSAPAKKVVKSAPVKKSVSAKKPVSKPVQKTMTKSANHNTSQKKPAVPVKKAAPAKATEVKKTAAKTESHQPISKALPAAKDIKVGKPKPVVLPKINTKSAKRYDPDFTKSILDKPAPVHSSSSQRYSDNELNEFRELINRKLETAKRELTYLQGLITRKDEMGGDEADNRYMTMEDGSLSMEREQLSQMASRQITFIDHLEKAIMRIENKTYGICRITGKLIDKARLRAVPHATLSMEAKVAMK